MKGRNKIMKKIIASNSRPLRSALCGLLVGAAALWALPGNAQAENIVYVTEPNSQNGNVGEYKASGAPIKADFLTTAKPSGLAVSGDILYVPNINLTTDQFVIATYNAKTGAPINLNFFAYPVGLTVGPDGMVLSGNYLYVANYYLNSIARIDATTGVGNANFIPYNDGTLGYPSALAIKGSNLYVTNNSLNANDDVYISEYDVTTGTLINANFIQIATGGLYGLAVKDNHLFVSIYAGSPPRVAEYNATTGALINDSFVTTVGEPWGIAVVGNTLFVGSYNDEVIYEFNATTGAQLSQSITLPTEPGGIAIRVVKKK
jgi:outer membrane protein assembly factor BamB